jgi:hypothetical protein
MNADVMKRVRCPGWLFAIMSVVMLGACAALPPPASPDALIQQAGDALKSGAPDQAVDLLTQASKANPANNEVWVKLSQAQFERQNYPKAIEAATEALARSPGNAEARSVMFVSSMRLAVNSLAEIRSDNPLSEGSRSEAEQLVKQLRETLGESVLVPGISKPVAKPRSRPATARTESPATTPAKQQAVASGNGADPFGALR